MGDDTRPQLALAHLARGFGYAEIGVSVLVPYQRRHIASVLLEHCIACGLVRNHTHVQRRPVNWPRFRALIDAPRVGSALDNGTGQLPCVASGSATRER